MLLKGYRKKIFWTECNPSFQSLHCIAHLDEDIREVLPYLNTVLGGDENYHAPRPLPFDPRVSSLPFIPTRSLSMPLRTKPRRIRSLSG